VYKTAKASDTFASEAFAVLYHIPFS